MKILYALMFVAAGSMAGTVNNSRTGNPLIFIGPYIVGNCVQVAAGGNVADAGAPCGSGGGGGNVASINADTSAAQTFTVGTAGSDFNITNPGAGAHVLNLPDASASNRGALISDDWTTFNNKVGGAGNPGDIAYWQTGSNITANIFFTYGGAGDATGSFLGVGTTTPLEKAHVVGNAIITGQTAIGGSAQAGLVSSTQRYVDIAQTITDFTATNSWRLHSDRLIVDPAADFATDTGTASFSQVSIPDTNANDFGNLIGDTAIASHAGDGAVNQNISRITSATLIGAGSIATNAADSITCQATAASAGTITSNYCHVFNSGNQSASSTIDDDFVTVYRTPRTDGAVTNHRAIYAEDQSGPTDSYFIYSEGGRSYHAGNVGIQNLDPPSQLTILDNLYFGTFYDGNGGWAGTGTAIELLHGGVRSSWHSTTGEAGVGVRFGTETAHPLFIRTDNTTAITINSTQQTDFSAAATFESDIGVDGRILGAMGTVTAANDITLPASGNLISIGSSAVPVNTIAYTGWTPGSVVIFLCTSTFVFHHNTAGAGGPILLAGSVDYTCVPDGTLTVVLDGTSWQETARKSP